MATLVKTAQIDPTARLVSKVITITRNMTAASGDVAYTGVGFQPTAIVAIGNINGNIGSFAIGIADSSAAEANMYGNANTTNYADNYMLEIVASAGNNQLSVLKNYGTDGFTLTWTKNGSIAFNAGKFGNGADFGTGTNSKYLNNSTNLGITGNSTFLFWVKLTTEVASGNYTFFEFDDNTAKVYYRVEYEYNGGTRRLKFQRVKNGVVDNNFYYTITLGTVNYNHIAITFNNSNLYGYVNGANIGNVAATGNGSSAVGNILIIGNSGNVNVATYGIIDDFIALSRALSDAEVLSINSTQIKKFMGISNV